MSFSRFILVLVTLTVFAGAARATPTVNFGGVGFEAARVAFVCDGSRWTKNKLIELAEELNRTVEPMTADQQFAVIFFADEKTTAFSDGKLVPATDENKRALADWLEDVETGDRSTPQAGLTRGFEAKPDAVVFTSGGMFKPYDDVEAHVDSLNPKREVRLYPIGFFKSEDEDDSRDFMRFMRRLAERNGGRAKAVYADELKRKR